uniref:Uncharacterized protein n=1 Tax=Arundo donax TaxID=35708 RepID=A0A0A8ZFN1_ARUDO
MELGISSSRIRGAGAEVHQECLLSHCVPISTRNREFKIKSF